MARRHPLWLLFAAIIVVGASYAVWQRTRPPVETPLERDWTAVVAVLAGDGVAGLRDAEADRARFSEPFGVASAPDGTVYVADAGGQSVAIRETDKLTGSFVEPAAVAAVADRLETWSRLVFEFLEGSEVASGTPSGRSPTAGAAPGDL